jgi:hypothetical protein
MDYDVGMEWDVGTKSPWCSLDFFSPSVSYSPLAQHRGGFQMGIAAWMKSRGFRALSWG